MSLNVYYANVSLKIVKKKTIMIFSLVSALNRCFNRKFEKEVEGEGEEKNIVKIHLFATNNHFYIYTILYTYYFNNTKKCVNTYG